MQRFCPWLLAGFTLLVSCSETPLPDTTNDKEVERALYMVNKIWDGEGKVITGRISGVLPRLIAARTPIAEDGSFTAAVAPGRQLTFYAHGYEPLWVEDPARVRGSIFDAGEVSFEKAPEDILRGWEAVVTSPEGSDEITGTLFIKNKDYLFKDHGTAGGSRTTVEVASQRIRSGETLSFGGLSDASYHVVISGEGLIQQVVEVDKFSRQSITHDPIAMEAARAFTFTYRARTKKLGEPWKEDKEVKRVRIVCNGKNEFPFTNVRDGLGNSHELRLTPTEEGIRAWFVFHGDDSFFDLGKKKLDPALHWDETDRSDGKSGMVLQSGHLYLFRKEDVNDLDMELLFAVE